MHAFVSKGTCRCIIVINEDYIYTLSRTLNLLLSSRLGPSLSSFINIGIDYSIRFQLNLPFLSRFSAKVYNTQLHGILSFLALVYD